MSKVRINDLARELEVKPRAIIDILPELGVPAGKTHSSSLEADEAEKVRAHFQRGTRSASHGSAPASRAPQGITPKIDLSHISKPGDVLKAIQAKQKEKEEEATKSRAPVRQPAPSAPVRPAPPTPATSVAATHPPAAPARPERKPAVPPVRQAPPAAAGPPAQPAIAMR